VTYRLPLGVRVLISTAGLPAGAVRAVADDDELLPALTAWRVWPLGDGSGVDVARGEVTTLLRGVLYSRFTTYSLAWLGGRMTAAARRTASSVSPA